MRFSQNLQAEIESVGEIARQSPISRRETERLLVKAIEPSGLSRDEVIALLNGLDDPGNGHLVMEFSRAYERPRDHEVFLLPPLYFSSICENACAYCDFSTGKGTRLSEEEFGDEVAALLGMGYRSIELVSSQDPELFVRRQPFDTENQSFELSGVVRYFELLSQANSSRGGGMITSNIPPVCGAGFEDLKAAGLDCFLVWLETFDPARYARLHGDNSPKGQQAFRVDSFDRALAAGVEHVAGAFLKGLCDWRREEAILYLLDRHLKERWGRGFSIIGSPRVKGRFLGSLLIADSLVSDEDYELNIALDRILFDGVLWLQTRESFDLNRRLINTYGGGVVLTLTSCTAPGGYAKLAEAQSQFPVHSQDHVQSAARLEQDGLTVHYAWDSADLSECQRRPRR